MPTARRSSTRSGRPTTRTSERSAGIDKLDPNLKRDKNWTYELTGSHELFPRVSVGGGYYHRHYFDLAWTDNLAVGDVNSGDWIPFTCIGAGGSAAEQRRRRTDHALQPGRRQGRA